jgi:hypothetical protein
MKRVPLLLAVALAASCAGERSRPAPPPPAPRSAPSAEGRPPTRWRLVHHETFDTPFVEPATWVEDTYGDASPYHVDGFDDDGEYFQERGGEAFRKGLAAFRSFRKSFRYGDGGWLTAELYGRDADRDGIPETGGRFVAEAGQARLISTRHFDGALITSTHPLPSRYRVEVTVADIRFGGSGGRGWSRDGRFNGYDGGERAGPWSFAPKSAEPLDATDQNGVYFLCIVDYDRPAPHNNVFIHHHRKVVLDTDNNIFPDGSSWSSVWSPAERRAVQDGDHYFGMFLLNGTDFGSDRTGNEFISYTPDGWKNGTDFVDKYVDGETYVVSIERDDDVYTLTAGGRFFHGGKTTYTARRSVREAPVVWHFNQQRADHPGPALDQTRTYGGKVVHTWPPDAAYPDRFIFGDPHINYYEGTALYDDLKLYLPE